MTAQLHNPTAHEVTQFLPLVYKTVARMAGRLPPNVLRDNLIAAGTYGLLDSLRRDGGERGPQFEWYARIRIKGAIVDELRAQDWLSRRARGRVTAAGKSETPSERATVVGFDDLPGRSGANLTDANDPSPSDLVEEQAERRALREAVGELPERERYIVSMHYFEGVQLKDIARKLGVSEPRVSQLHARAVSMLRQKMAA